MNEKKSRSRICRRKKNVEVIKSIVIINELIFYEIVGEKKEEKGKCRSFNLHYNLYSHSIFMDFNVDGLQINSNENQSNIDSFLKLPQNEVFELIEGSFLKDKFNKDSNNLFKP